MVSNISTICSKDHGKWKLPAACLNSWLIWDKGTVQAVGIGGFFLVGFFFTHENEDRLLQSLG